MTVYQEVSCSVPNNIGQATLLQVVRRLFPKLFRS